MPTIDVNGKAVELNEEGFLAHPEEWNEDIAAALARAEEGIEVLGEGHWAVIRYIRQYYLEKNLAPMVTVTTQNMGVRTGTVTKGPLRRIIRTVAAIDYDETSLVDVTMKFKGWITKLDVNVTGQQVHKGDPLFEIYSPDLYSAQTEYLMALNNPADAAGGAQTLKSSALTKLKYFDVPDEQIAQLEKTRQVTKTLRINAPRDGIVVEKDAVEGQMVDAGMKLYRLADLWLGLGAGAGL